MTTIPLRYRMLRRVRRWLGARRDDDFDWKLYDLHYSRELAEIEKTHTLRLQPGDYELAGGRLVRRALDRKPLQDDWRLLYETILQLAPRSACEFGCGGGDHLENLSLLAPGLRLLGMDRSRRQLEYLRRRHPTLTATVLEHSIADPLPPAARGFDLAYVRAVVMHMHTGQEHLRALGNLFQAASRHVVMQENWTRHAFLDDLRALHRDGRIPWKELHVHYRSMPETDRPLLMVVGAEPLPDYPVLEDYAVLRDAVPA